MITKILSTNPTWSLGHFEVQYLYNPKVVKITEKYENFIRFERKLIFFGWMQVPPKVEGVVKGDEWEEPEEGFPIWMAWP